MILLIASGIAHAQTTKKIKIELDPCGNGRSPDVIDVVLYEEGIKPHQISRPDKSQLVWVFTLREKEAPIDAAGSRASLRLRGSRTGCRRSTLAKDPEKPDKYMAVFHFNCDQQPVRQAKVETVPAIPVSYVRNMPRRKGLTDPPDCDSVEPDVFEGVEQFNDVRFPAERLRLQINWSRPKKDGPGLDVFDPKGENPRASPLDALNPAIRNNSSQSGTRVYLTWANVQAALAAQNASGNNGSAGRFLENQMEFAEIPEDKKGRGLTLTVK